MCLFSFGVSLLIDLIKNKKCFKEKINGIVIPSKAGCSKLINGFSQSQNYIIVDLMENIKLTLKEDELNLFNSLNRENPSFNVHVLPIIKKYVDNLKKEFKNKKIYIFSSNKQDLIYCGIKNIHSYIPNTEFSQILMNSQDSDENKQIFNKSRLENLLSCSEKERSIYENFDHLKKLISEKYKINLKI